ncbi:MAG: RHS repeat-associated core domain-containing protein [Terriglobales bacterium]
MVRVTTRRTSSLPMSSTSLASTCVYGPTGAKLAKVNGTTLIKAFVALPGGAKAIYNSTGLAYYRHSDWLGSSRLTSTAVTPTSMYSSTAYAPFGEQYATSGTADASFTGQDQDTVSTLYDFPARRQSPSQGRWISPDPAGRGAVNLANPQSWNRYAYVLNNPLSFTDPTGRNLDNTCAGAENCGGGGGGDDDDDDDSPPDINIPTSPMPDLGPDNPDMPELVVFQEVDVTDTVDPVAILALDPLIGWLFQPVTCDADCQKQQNCAKGLQMANKSTAAVNRANTAWDTLQTAADANNVDPAMLAAIGVRESNFQNVNQGDGPGVGVFQITVSPNSGVTATQAGNLAWAANYAAAMLDSNMDFLGNQPQLQSFTQTQLLQATAASYNMGLGNPRGSNFSGNPNTIDVGTKYNNYGSNILLLMDCF